jgi:hypothetical protein
MAVVDPAAGRNKGKRTRLQGNRGDELVRAIIARPGVADASFEIELGYLGGQ